MLLIIPPPKIQILPSSTWERGPLPSLLPNFRSISTFHLGPSLSPSSFPPRKSCVTVIFIPVLPALRLPRGCSPPTSWESPVSSCCYLSSAPPPPLGAPPPPPAASPPGPPYSPCSPSRKTGAVLHGVIQHFYICHVNVNSDCRVL